MVSLFVLMQFKSHTKKSFLVIYHDVNPINYEDKSHT